MADIFEKDTDLIIKELSLDHVASIQPSTKSEFTEEVGEPDGDGLPTEPQLEAIQRVTTIEEDFSVLSVGQKKLIIIAASFASLFSPMATAIYCE